MTKKLMAVNIFTEGVYEIYGPSTEISNISVGLLGKDDSTQIQENYSVIKLTLEQSTRPELKSLIADNGGVHALLMFPTRLHFIKYINKQMNSVKSGS